jgi:hypothetical protein
MNMKNSEPRRMAYALIFTFFIFMTLVAPQMIFPAGSSIVWGNEEEISTDDNKDPPQRDPSIAVENGNVYAVWGHYDGKDYEIYFRENDSVSWGPEEHLTDDMGDDQWNPDIAVENGVIHVVWYDMAWGDWDISYIKREGGVWAPIVSISDDAPMQFQWFPKVAVSGGNVYVVWQDGRGGDWDIYFTYHDGVGWITPQEISVDSTDEGQEYPRIAAGGGKVYVVWEDGGGGDMDIVMRVYDGSSWGSIMTVSEDTAADEEQEEPDVAFDGGTVHIVWQQINGSDRDIFYRSWDGTSFSAIQTVNKDFGAEFQFVPAVTAQFGKVHVVWADARDGSPDRDIMYRQFDGASWLNDPEEISDDAVTEAQFNPEIVTEDGMVYVVWEDQNPGNTENDIYYLTGFEPPPPDTFSPLITDVLIDGVPVRTVAVGTPTVTLTATVDDSTTGDSDIGGANFTIGQANWGTSTSMFPDGPLDSSVEGFNYDVDTSSLIPGTYEIWVYGWDNKSNENVIGAFATLIVVEAIHLEPGWNLASFPHVVNDTDITTVLGSINGEYNNVWRYNSSDPADCWKHYHSAIPPSGSDLYNLNNSMGFWIYITDIDGADLIIDGMEPAVPQNILLRKGWNLVGYPSITPLLRDAALNNLNFNDQITVIRYYDTAEDRIKPVGPGDTMEPGKGYWMYATQNCVWTVNN